MRRKSIWQLIRNEMRSSARSRARQCSKGDWQGVGDTVHFKPHKSGTLSIWRDTYKLERQLREIERGIYQSTQQTWLGTLKWKIRSAWHDLVDEVKALLTEMFFHVLRLVLIVVFNIIWFAFLFWVIGVWLDW